MLFPHLTIFTVVPEHVHNITGRHIGNPIGYGLLCTKLRLLNVRSADTEAGAPCSYPLHHQLSDRTLYQVGMAVVNNTLKLC